jgi:hypothetical protein
VETIARDTSTVQLLKAIGLGGESSAESARSLESSILADFADADDDKRFEQLLYILASYNPIGGAYLYDAAALAEEARRVLSLVIDQGKQSVPGQL